jgi:hypothetical protein
LSDEGHSRYDKTLYKGIDDVNSKGLGLQKEEMRLIINKHI